MVEDAIVDVGLGLISTAVYDGTSLTRKKAEQLLHTYNIDQELDNLNTEFAIALETAIEDIDTNSGTGELAGVTNEWETIIREVHGLTSDQVGADEKTSGEPYQKKVIFRDLEEAVDTFAEAIAQVHGYDLSKTGALERELKRALASAYSEAMKGFIDNLAGTDLGDQLLIEAQFEELDELHTIHERLENLEKQLAIPRRYDRIDVGTGGLDTAITKLTTREFTFVDRPELEGANEIDRLLIVGPGGAGKSRALAHIVRHYKQEIEHIVIPNIAFKDQEHLRRLRDEHFDGNVLLVWDDIHDIAPEENNAIFRQTVAELDAELSDEVSLYILSTARIEQLDQFSGNPMRKHASDTLWDNFEVRELEPLTTEGLTRLLEVALTESGVTASEEVKSQFLRRARKTDPSPIYVTSVVETAGDELTKEDIRMLPEDALGIWKEQYDEIYETNDNRRYILLAVKLLSDIGIPLYRSLIEGVYSEVFDKDVYSLDPHLDDLQKRQWLVEYQTDEGAVWYATHDIKLEAIDESVQRAIGTLSDFFKDELHRYLPIGADGIVKICHTHLARYAEFSDIRNGSQLAERHYLEIIDENGIDPEDPTVHTNYAVFLGREERNEEAQHHFKRALNLTSPSDDPFKSDFAYGHARYAYWLAKSQSRRVDDSYQRAEIFDNLSIAHRHADRAIEILSANNSDNESILVHAHQAAVLSLYRDDLNPEAYRMGVSHAKAALNLSSASDKVADIEIEISHYHLAWFAERLNRFREADEHYKKALSLSSSDGNPINAEKKGWHQNYAFLLWLLSSHDVSGDHLERGHDHIKRALELDSPTNDPLESEWIQAHRTCITILNKIGRSDEASRYSARLDELLNQKNNSHTSNKEAPF